MSADVAQGVIPNTRKRSRATMQPADPAPSTAPEPSANDGFVVDQDAADSAGDDEEEEVGKSDKKAGRRKIKIEFIQDKSRRHITFSKRKAGIMKKAYELSTLTGTQVLLLVVSETGLVYTFTTAKLQPLVTQPEGKNLIQACLNAPHGALPSNMPVGAPLGRSVPAPQQIQTSAAQQQQSQQGPHMTGMPPPPPPMGGARNVPGGLSIGGQPGSATSGGPGEDGDGDRDAHDEADAEGEKRGQSRRRTSGAGKNNSANNAQGGRSPTTPNVGSSQQGGVPPMGQSPYGGAPPSAGHDGAPGYPSGPPPHGGQYPHVPQMMAGGYYPPPPGMGAAWGPPPQGGPPQNAYGRR